MKTAIVYFTRSGVTRAAAEYMARKLDADTFELRPAEPYPEEYRAVVERAMEELRAKTRPPLAEMPDVSGYDTVLVGSPNWCGTFAAPWPPSSQVPRCPESWWACSVPAEEAGLHVCRRRRPSWRPAPGLPSPWLSEAPVRRTPWTRGWLSWREEAVFQAENANFPLQYVQRCGIIL